MLPNIISSVRNTPHPNSCMARSTRWRVILVELFQVPSREIQPGWITRRVQIMKIRVIVHTAEEGTGPKCLRYLAAQLR